MACCARSVRVLCSNHITKLNGSRNFLRTIRGSRYVTPKRISRCSQRALDNLLSSQDLCSNLDTNSEGKSTFVINKKPDISTKYFQEKSEIEHAAKESLPGLEPNLDKSPLLFVPPENQNDLLLEKMTPLCKIPYDEQLIKKYMKCRNLMKDVGKTLKKEANIHIGSDNLPCPVNLVVPSPITEQYRNKDEFSIRYGIDGNPKTVGFFLDSPAENPDTLCIKADEVVIIKECHKSLANDFEDYMRQSSLPPLIHFSDGGYWKNIVVRSNTQDDLMAVVKMHPQNLTKEELEVEKHKLKEYFALKNMKDYKLKSLYFQASYQVGSSSPTAPSELLLGEPYIYESLNGFQFQISPDAFFQTNTAAAACLLKSVSKLCKFSPSTVLLDICCGSGPFSICFSPFIKRSIGIDISAQAIDNAKANAKLNNVENVEFYCGVTECFIPDILDDIHAEELIAIVNPSSQALGKQALYALRKCKYLKKVVYVSCKPERAVSNYTQLCSPPRKYMQIGKSFSIMMATPVDMFPQTNHCELVTLFQRL